MVVWASVGTTEIIIRLNYDFCGRYKQISDPYSDFLYLSISLSGKQMFVFGPIGVFHWDSIDKRLVHLCIDLITISTISLKGMLKLKRERAIAPTPLDSACLTEIFVSRRNTSDNNFLKNSLKMRFFLQFVSRNISLVLFYLLMSSILISWNLI